MGSLVIVESPTKAKTLTKFLGSEYEITSSMGHVRDLPKSELGVDVEHNFEPKYIVPRDKKKKANELIKLAKGADQIYLASDPDREGEAIAWHLEQLLNAKRNHEIKRVVFHEITEGAIKEAFKHPKEIDLPLVDAQQARRVLDRLVGYTLSPLLWQKVKKGLSAGRVQSVALRLIIEREREIEAFKPDEYWVINVILSNGLIVTLIEINAKKVEIKNEAEAKLVVEFLEKAIYEVSKVTKREVKRHPYPPFITSTLQQVASNKLGFSAKKTMMIAQALYEHGLITYMRTDSVNLASVAIDAVREYIDKTLGKPFLPLSPRVYKSKSKNAQEAHEAIRPTDVRVKGEALRVKDELNRDHERLYDLIWKRFVACQMNEAILDQTTIDVLASKTHLLRATGSVVKFPGWLSVYGIDEEDEKDESKILPDVAGGTSLDKKSVLSQQHFTQPPPRYNEASLIKRLEELGIGRPSTYAPIMSTLIDRFYIERKEKRLFATSLGSTVIDFLMKYFADIVDYEFTAGMEDKLDEIARGERQWRPVMSEFYTPFAKKIAETGETAEKMQLEVETTDKICPKCGKGLVVKIGRFGKFLACSGFPDCKHTESFDQITDVKCPDDGGDIVIRRTKKGRTFYGCKNWPGCKYASWNKPKG